MTPTQIAELEAEFIRRARANEAAGDQLNASTWRLAAALLTTAATDTSTAAPGATHTHQP
jgi:hypothetical protein